MDRPIAVRTLMRRPDGTMGVAFIDPNTGQIIQDPTGYNIVEAGDVASLEQLGLDPTQTPNEPESTAQEVTQEARNFGSDGGDIDGRLGETQSPRGGRSRTPNNNYGFIDKPSALGIAGALAPGGIGLALGAVDKGINLNNMAATNAARQGMGIPGLGVRESIGGFLTGTKGDVADVSIGDNNYSVGFKAQDRFGRTTLTPEEASKRAQVMGHQLSLAPEDEVKSSIRSFQDQHGRKGIGGVVSGLVNASRSFFDNMFGVSQASSSKDRGAFPDAPSSSKAADRDYADRQLMQDLSGPSPNKDMSLRDQYASYGAGRAGRSGFEGSAQASAAADKASRGEIDGLW